MSLTANGASAHKMIAEFRPHITIPEDENFETFGPIGTTERDAGGYLIRYHQMILLRRENREWSLVRQIDQFSNGHVWPSPPSIQKFSETEARQWLKEFGPILNCSWDDHANEVNYFVDRVYSKEQLTHTLPMTRAFLLGLSLLFLMAFAFLLMELRNFGDFSSSARHAPTSRNQVGEIELTTHH